MEAAIKTFFSSPRFAVAGASSDPTKYGHIVFKWYLEHSLPVTPLNPTSETITVEQKKYPVTKSPANLQNAHEYSLSIITKPKITKDVLKEAKEAGIKAIWMQPGSFDPEVLRYANQEFEAVVAGDGGRGGEGWCVLVDGEEGLRSAGREWGVGKL